MSTYLKYMLYVDEFESIIYKSYKSIFQTAIMQFDAIVRINTIVPWYYSVIVN
jgi:hypothetical protein